MSAVAAGSSLAGCNDVRDFRGDWQGARVGDAPVLKVGVSDTASADLDINTVDVHGLSATLSIDGLVSAADVESLPGAEADALAQMTFTGAPLRVYLGFVPILDGIGEAMVMIALYDDARVEVRVMRGGLSPIYAIFTLASSSSSSS
jgi:hypothetical protein